MDDGMASRWERILSGIEWRWSLGHFIWGAPAAIGSFALPAWAVSAMSELADYSPASWVLAGFGGLACYTLCMLGISYARILSVSAKYNNKFLISSGPIDPMSKVFESKRIFLNDLVLPSSPIVEHKTFVDCEIVGPSNCYLEVGNNINDIREGLVDAVALSGERQFFNGVLFRHCTFRNCRFHRITFFFNPTEIDAIVNLRWLNFISVLPLQQSLQIGGPPSIEGISPEALPGTEEKKQP